ncbi:choice-of-anchor I family protein [Microbacterium sp. P05]|uniref:choice-of-anchor I family protein n=1 Tax=Microbacterium sp. P05 TaxID=3366948 RepID=UPI00374625E8
MPIHPFRRAVAFTATTVAVCALALSSASAASAAIVPTPISDAVADAPFTLTPVGTHETGTFDESAAEIVHAYGDRLFVVNARAGSVTVLDISDPAVPTELYAITAEGVANSLAVRSDGLGVIAFQAEDKTAPGRLVFFDADAAAPTILGSVVVGALPDMVSISADGTYAVVANEGEPADTFSTDPEGSIGVVTLPTTKTSPAQAAVKIAGFEAFEGDALPDGVRVFGPDVAAPDQGAAPLSSNRVSRNLEPEFIAIDGSTAYAALQEANSVAVVDLTTATVTDIMPLGYIDRGVEGNGLDASNDDDAINIATYEDLFGVYMPDGLNAYQTAGETFLVTANEGDARADFGDFSDEARVADLADDGQGPICADSPLSAQTDDVDLGRLNVITDLGFDATAQCYDELYAFGGRGFAIWSTDGELVFNSGDDFEQITADVLPDNFNSTHAESNFDNRSDDKGPEPENLAIGQVGDRTYAFIGLERVGGVMVYDITDPENAEYVTYANNRDFAFSGDEDLPNAGDLGAEGLEFISAEDSSTGEPMLAVANEVSGTTTLFAIDDGITEINVLTINDFHGRLEAGTGTATEAGAAGVAGAVNAIEAENPNTLFVSAGDNIGASTFTSFIQQDNPTIDTLVDAGLDVSAVGNHEFDRGFDDLLNRVIPRFGGNTDPENVTAAQRELGEAYGLGANVYDAETGEPVLPEYAIKTVDGVRVAFIGTVTADTAKMVDPAGIAGIEFGDQAEAADRVAGELTEGGLADVIILLTHSGAATSDDCAALAADQAGFGALATGVSEEIDAIVSAHTHQTYACEVAIDGTDGQTRPVIQASEYGKAMGQLELKVDSASKELLSIEGSTFPLKGAYPIDEEIAAQVADYVADSDVIGAEPVGQISGDILRGGTPPGADRGVESSMGNWVADVYLWATSNEAYTGTPAQIALMNPGGLRADLLKGEDGIVTYKEAAVVQPFANTLVTVTLAGAQIQEILQQQWQATGDRPKLHLGVSEGFTYEYVQDTPRSGRIVSMSYLGEPIAPTDTFTVVTNSFLANGGDGFTTFSEGTDRTDTGQVDLEATLDYFEAMETVDPAPVGRAIVSTSTPSPQPTLPNTGPGTPPTPVNPGGTPPAAGVQTGGTWADVALSNGGRIEQGGTLSVTVSDLDPGQQISATLFSDPIVVGAIPAANASGTTTFAIAIPADFDLGAHRLVITAAGEDPISVGVTVVSRGALAATGAELPWGIALGGAALLLTGGLAFALRSRRKLVS